MIQAKEVGSALVSAHSNLSVEYFTTKTTADRDLTIDITNPKNIGLFTRDISSKVVDGEYDIAIHSWKDLPIEPSSGTEIIGTLERGDMRDVMLMKKDLRKLNYKEKINILTSSPRRQFNIGKLLTELIPMDFGTLTFSEIRGNIETRLNKFISTNADIFIIAKVALDRLINSGDEDTIKLITSILRDVKWMVLPLSIFPTAPGQGAIAIEAKKDSSDLKDLVKPINCEQTFFDVKKEKEILAQFGGGCQQKIGVSLWNARDIKMHSMVGQTEDGTVLNKLQKIEKNISRKNYISANLIYPNKSDKKIYIRKNISSKSINNLKNSFILIGRKNIFKDLEPLHDSNILWTSGIKSWRYAVQKGYWINGTLDNMGEDIGVDIGSLTHSTLKKYKLTHRDATSENYEIIPQYELEFDKNVIKNLNLDKRSDFFWMSPLQFQKALEYYPEIINGNHSCGLGRTYEFLKKNIPKSKHISCYFSYEHWLEHHKQ